MKSETAFGARARAIMTEKNLTMSEVARRMRGLGHPSIEYQHVQNLLARKRPHDRTRLFALLDALELAGQEKFELVYLFYSPEDP